MILVPILISLATIFALSHGQQHPSHSRLKQTRLGRSDLRRRAGHAVARAGSQIIVHGGLKYDVNVGLRYNHDTCSIPLNHNWTTRTLQTTCLESNISGLQYPTLWYDEKRETLYRFGGKLSSDSGIDWSDPIVNTFIENRSPTLWALPLNGGIGAWSMIMGHNTITRFPPDLQQPALGASTTDRNGAFYLGGVISNWSSSSMSNTSSARNTPGIIHFGFDTQNLTNSTDDGRFFASRNPGTNETWYLPGPLFDAPFGPDGVLISMAGRTMPYLSDDEHGAGWENVWIYNKTSRTSYYQKTTGAIPPTDSKLHTLSDWRMGDWCFFSAVDDSLKTFDIFVYANFNASTGVNTVYVLSLPSFVWHTTQFENYPRRLRMACVSSGMNNQAVFVGGFDPMQPYWNTSDEWAQGIAVFDMTTLELKDSYNADAPTYAASDTVRATYDSGNRYPTVWTSPEVEATFKVWNSNATSNNLAPTVTIPPNSRPTDTSDSRPKKRNNKLRITLTAVLVPVMCSFLILSLCWHYNVLGFRKRMQGRSTPTYELTLLNNQSGDSLAFSEYAYSQTSPNENAPTSI